MRVFPLPLGGEGWRSREGRGLGDSNGGEGWNVDGSFRGNDR